MFRGDVDSFFFGDELETMETLIEAQNRGDFDLVLRELLATAEKGVLEELVISLTSKVEQMGSTEARNQILRGIQSIRAALKIRFYET